MAPSADVARAAGRNTGGLAIVMPPPGPRTMNFPPRITATTATLLTALLALASGCASITDGTSQTVVFHLTPKEAREGSQLGIVTGRQNTVTLDKGAKDVLVQCSAPGHENATQRLVSRTQTSGVVGGFFLDLGITDMITGAMWKYPNEISIALEPSAPEPAAATARDSQPGILPGVRRAGRSG